MNINIYVYINANQLLKKGLKVKWGISKLALRGTQTKAISQSVSLTLCPSVRPQESPLGSKGPTALRRS